MIAIQREKWIDCIDELMPLCHAAFDLGEHKKVGFELDLDAELYQQMCDANILHCLVMRKGDVPIGMHWIYITPTPRHKGKVMAQTDVIYVLPEHRNSSIRLINWSEQYIKNLADMWILSNRPYSDRGKLWARKGFGLIETVMIKRV
jgi:hypothetical protein